MSTVGEWAQRLGQGSRRSMDARAEAGRFNPSARAYRPAELHASKWSAHSEVLSPARRRGRAAWVERLRWRAPSVPTMKSVHLTRTRLFLLAALAAVALLAPAVAEAASTPDRSEGVTVKRYLMGRVKPTVRARGAAHLWTNTGFSNRRAVYPVVRH